MKGSPLSATFAALKACGLDVTAVELAEIIWLARHLPTGQSSKTSGLLSAPEDIGDVRAGSELPPPGGEPIGHRPAPLVTGEPSTAASTPQTTGLFANVDQSLLTGRTRRATLVRAPAAPALPGALALSRALRPLLKKRGTTRRWQLDEEATADASAASGGLVTPIFRPGTERWFEVALVVDESASMRVWRQMISELRRLLVRHGGFRNLRQYALRTDVATEAGFSIVSAADRQVEPQALADPSGRRLIVVVTDAVADAWSRAPLRRTLFAWGSFSPVVLLHVLPRRMWPHTAVGLAEREMRPRRAGAPNAEWRVDRVLSSREGLDKAVRLPVMTLDALQFGKWATSLMQVSAGVCTGTLLTVNPVQAASETSQAEEPSAHERIQRFRAVGSAEAYQLACFFATCPLSLPVLRIVQRQMMPATGTGQLAEFLLSGLIYERGAAGPTAGSEAKDPETALYEFYPGVRDILVDQIQQSEAEQIVRLIEDYLAEHFGESYDLRALVPDETGKYEIDAAAVPFVAPAAGLLERMGVRPQPAASPNETERLLGILRRDFGETRIPRQLEQNLRALRASPDEQRYLLLSTAIELMPAERREQLLPLGVTESAPPVSPGLWRQLFDRNGVAPLEEMGGLSFDEHEQLTLEPNLRNSLREQVAAGEIGSLHGRIVETYRRSRALPGTGDHYYYTHFMKHVSASGETKLAEDLLFDVAWIAAKIQVQRVPQYLDDLKRFPGSSQIQSLYEVAAGRYQHWEDAEEWAMSLLAAWEDRGRVAAEQSTQATEPPQATAVAGDIYKGRVSRVEPGLQSSFIDVGLERAGFLHVSDAIDTPEAFERREAGADQDEGNRNAVATEAAKIEDIVREGQDILVQVIKEPVGTKGARLSSHISIPGRFLVFMPTGDQVGVSAKIESREERRRLREIIRELRESQGFTGGLIVREAASGRPKDDIVSDLQALHTIWTGIVQKTESAPAPALLYREPSPAEKLPDLPTERPQPSVKGWVLVAGPSIAPVGTPESDVADALGRMLAAEGYGLISGDSPGVDSAVVGRYVRAVEGGVSPLTDVLVQMTWAQRPTHSVGQSVRYHTDREYLNETLSRADAAVTIGTSPFLKELEESAVNALIPVASITATESPGFSLAWNPVLPATRPGGGVSGDFEHTVQRVSTALREARPGWRISALSTEYLRSSLAAAVRGRLRFLLGRQPDFDPGHLVDPDVRELLYAMTFHRRPTIQVLQRLADDHPASAMLLERLTALRTAFDVEELRGNLPPALEDKLRHMYNRLDDETGHQGPAAEAKTLLARELLPLARLVTVVRRVVDPSFDDDDELVSAAAVLSPLTAFDMLNDHDPGWRLAGLARCAAEPLKLGGLTVPDPSGATGERRELRAILGVTRYESTYPAHARLVVRACLAIARTGFSAGDLTEEERYRLGQIGRLAANDQAMRELSEWLESSLGSAATSRPAGAAQRPEAGDPRIHDTLLPRAVPEKFLVAFSFAGDQRDLIRAIAKSVEEVLGLGTVFFDEWFESYIAGGDVGARLSEIYREKSELVVVCVSADYSAKPWTRAEHEAIRARAMELRGSDDDADSSRILAIRTGDGDIPGFGLNTIVPDVRGISVAETTDLIVNRLRLIVPEVTPGVKTRGRVVFLAEGTPDLEEFRRHTQRSLEQRGWTVLPRFEYGDEQYGAALERDVTESLAFVQLLGPYPWKRRGLDRPQSEVAVALGKPRFLWRSPEIDLEKVDVKHRETLTAPDVVVTSFGDFRIFLEQELESIARRSTIPADRIGNDDPPLVAVVIRSTNPDRLWETVFRWLYSEERISAYKLRPNETIEAIYRKEPCHGILLACDATALEDGERLLWRDLEQCRLIQIGEKNAARRPPVAVVYWSPPPPNWARLLLSQPLKLHRILGDAPTNLSAFIEDVRNVAAVSSK